MDVLTLFGEREYNYFNFSVITTALKQTYESFQNYTQFQFNIESRLQAGTSWQVVWAFLHQYSAFTLQTHLFSHYVHWIDKIMIYWYVIAFSIQYNIRVSKKVEVQVTARRCLYGFNIIKVYFIWTTSANMGANT